MLTPEQIIHLYEQWSGTPGSTYADLMQAAYAQALKDAAEVCETIYGQTGRTFDHRACAAAILALGKDQG